MQRHNNYFMCKKIYHLSVSYQSHFDTIEVKENNLSAVNLKNYDGHIALTNEKAALKVKDDMQTAVAQILSQDGIREYLTDQTKEFLSKLEQQLNNNK